MSVDTTGFEGIVMSEVATMTFRYPRSARIVITSSDNGMWEVSVDTDDMKDFKVFRTFTEAFEFAIDTTRIHVRH